MSRQRPRGGPRAVEEPSPAGSAAVDPEPDPESVARSIALRQLATAPRTRAQLGHAMAKRDVPNDVAGRVLDRFEEVKLVDDAEYARMWVRSRAGGHGRSRRVLAQELAERGVAREIVEDALSEIDRDDEVASARALVAGRLARTRGLDPAVRVRRLAAMLARRGYPAGLALRVVTEAVAAEEEEFEEFDGPPR